MTPKQGLAFVKRHGIVLQAARGPIPSLAEAIVGGPIRGSWWAHPKGAEIYAVADAISESDDVLVCKLVEGKVTYVHRRLWPALVKMASRFSGAQLAKIGEEHTDKGTHRSTSSPFPEWVPDDVLRDAEALSEEAAEQLVAACWTPAAPEHPRPPSKRPRARRSGAGRQRRACLALELAGLVERERGFDRAKAAAAKRLQRGHALGGGKLPTRDELRDRAKLR
jgi:hypothetical protein